MCTLIKICLIARFRGVRLAPVVWPCVCSTHRACTAVHPSHSDHCRTLMLIYSPLPAQRKFSWVINLLRSSISETNKLASHDFVLILSVIKIRRKEKETKKQKNTYCFCQNYLVNGFMCRGFRVAARRIMWCYRFYKSWAVIILNRGLFLSFMYRWIMERC